MGDGDLYKDISRRILEKIKEGFGTYFFRSYIDGDPVVIPKSMLPALIVEQTDYERAGGPTGFDRWRETIVIKVVLDKMEDAGAGDMNADILEAPTYKKIKTVIFGRDETTKKFLAQSVMGILAVQFTLDEVNLEQDIRIRLGAAERGDELVTAEGHLEFTASELVEIGQRE